RCGKAGLFRGPFAMRPECPVCGLSFEPEMGYYVGAIYINYAFTVGVALAGYFLLDRFTGLPLKGQLLLWGTFCVLFPLVFFRFSKGLWLSLDFIFNPPTESGSPPGAFPP
ncbi:MAG: DUF983 domain-containing protein, partial [Nitrospinota bacterium]